MNKTTIIVIISLSLLLCINISYGQNQTMMSVGAGISSPTGDLGEEWNIGFAINGEWFIQYSENLFIGGRFAYNRWGPDEDGITRGLPNEYGDWVLDVSGHVIELLPSVRYVLSSNEGQQMQFFVQLGGGIYGLTIEGEVSGSYHSTYSSGTYNTGIDGKSGSDVGINFGAGAIIVTGNRKFFIYPNYNIIFSYGETVNYFTVNLGLLFGN